MSDDEIDLSLDEGVHEWSEPLPKSPEKPPPKLKPKAKG
jgi:hypothetical protein